jgi:DNA-binding LacI/PurR family transcriptional regulator
MNRKKINIKEFSKILGVSTATVSRAFSGNGRISKKTQKYIIEKAGEYGYHPNPNARNLILQRSDSIAFFYPSLIKGEPDFFIAEIILGINETLISHSYKLELYPFEVKSEFDKDSLSKHEEKILNSSLAGVIILSGTKEAESLEELTSSYKIPYSIIKDYRESAPNSVIFNTHAGAREVGEHFKNSGYKSPAFVSGLQDINKIDGFCDGLGKELASKIIIDRGGSTFESGREAFIRLKDQIDCVFCANDSLAIGFVKEAINAGKKIPEELSVIGCDNIKFSSFYTPSLSTINIPKYRIGELAVEIIINKILGNSTDEHFLDCELVLRES